MSYYGRDPINIDKYDIFKMLWKIVLMVFLGLVILGQCR